MDPSITSDAGHGSTRVGLEAMKEQNGALSEDADRAHQDDKQLPAATAVLGDE